VVTVMMKSAPAARTHSKKRLSSATPATLDEYASVLADQPEFVAEIAEVSVVCYPLTELHVIRHRLRRSTSKTCASGTARAFAAPAPLSSQP
jgi:hypothetical protein